MRGISDVWLRSGFWLPAAPKEQRERKSLVLNGNVWSPRWLWWLASRQGECVCVCVKETERNENEKEQEEIFQEAVCLALGHKSSLPPLLPFHSPLPTLSPPHFHLTHHLYPPFCSTVSLHASSSRIRSFHLFTAFWSLSVSPPLLPLLPSSSSPLPLYQSVLPLLPGLSTSMATEISHNANSQL